MSVYADDTSIYSASDINEAVNADLNALELWLQGKKLSLNVAKTEGMIVAGNTKLQNLISSVEAETHFKIGSEDVRMVTETKYLGVKVDRELKWAS